MVLSTSGDNLALHERARHESIARLLAQIKGLEFAGEAAEDGVRTDACYYVPHRTLVGMDRACRLGIIGEDDLYGGVVSEPFLGGKAIVHPLVGPDAVRPPGWSDRFAAMVAPAVVPGYATFAPEDALKAACRLLRIGAVRLKCAACVGGAGQAVVCSIEEMRKALEAGVDWPLVLELNLAPIVTFSIGCARIGDIVVSYFGAQHVTKDNSNRAAPPRQIANFARAFRQAHSLTRLLIPGADHGLSQPAWREVAARMLTEWLLRRRPAGAPPPSSARHRPAVDPS